MTILKFEDDGKSLKIVFEDEEERTGITREFAIDEYERRWSVRA